MKLLQFRDKIAIFDFQFRKDLQTTIPKIIANKAVFLFKKNFQDESFFGARWKEVNRRIPHQQTYFTKSGKKRTRVAPAKGADGKRKILTGRTGNLGRSIKSVVLDFAVKIISDLPYSRAHNEGTDNAGRGRNTRIPQRQFIGDSPEIRDLTQKTITEYFYKDINK